MRAGGKREWEAGMFCCGGRRLNGFSACSGKRRCFLIVSCRRREALKQQNSPAGSSDIAVWRLSPVSGSDKETSSFPDLNERIGFGWRGGWLLRGVGDKEDSFEGWGYAAAVWRAVWV